MFLVPVPFLLTVLLVIGVAQFYLTGDVGVAFEHAKAFRLSPGNLWLSYAAYGITAIVVGYRLAVRLRAAAILHIWLSIALFGFVHFILHASSDAAYIGALDDYRYLQFPFVLVVTAFAGFHLGCWHYRGAHIKR